MRVDLLRRLRPARRSWRIAASSMRRDPQPADVIAPHLGARRCAISCCSSAPIQRRVAPGPRDGGFQGLRRHRLRLPERRAGGRPSAPLLETSFPGVFAIGDVRAGSTKRVAAAVGEGGAVVAQIHTALALQSERIG
jgi:hypothetical protein